MFARNLKIKYPHIKYINVDLPHSNYVFYKNLTNYFEEKMFNTNFEINKSLNDFNLLNCWEIELLQNKSIDFAINMRSFMEMDMAICNYYLDNLRKKMKMIKNYF